MTSSYCNAVLQCLYYSKSFRQNVVGYPRRTVLDAIVKDSGGQVRLHVNTTSLPLDHPSLASAKLMGTAHTSGLAENADYKKKLAQTRGPTITMDYNNAAAYDMPESLFSGLKDIFEAICTHQSRIGVVSPTQFLLTLRRDNEMFRSAMHQDAHEFLNLLLNDVVENVEAHQAKNPRQGNKSRWVHDLFEGLLTSETKCLTCENISQRDEVFLDLSLDLTDNSSVTSCLRKFSQEEMLCEKNKFHCDNCGGLQEAERRMKIKRLPRILALHLKRFKYTEDLQQLQKLFHRVVYPYHLRLFNTTDDIEDPDRLYELYALVVHIGGGPYHGHYVAIIKTEDRGWLLFDDELVQPVDQSYVKNFFGNRTGLACAYILFYQEIAYDIFKREQAEEGRIPCSEDIVNAPTAHDEFEAPNTPVLNTPKSKKELQKEEKERKITVRKQIQEEVEAERTRRKIEDLARKENGVLQSRDPVESTEISSSFTSPLSRLKSTSRSLRKSKTKDSSENFAAASLPIELSDQAPESLRSRFQALRKKTSMMML